MASLSIESEGLYRNCVGYTFARKCNLANFRRNAFNLSDGQMSRMRRGKMSIETLERLLELIGFDRIEWRGNKTGGNEDNDFITLKALIRERAAANKNPSENSQSADHDGNTVENEES